MYLVLYLVYVLLWPTNSTALPEQEIAGILISLRTKKQLQYFDTLHAPQEFLLRLRIHSFSHVIGCLWRANQTSMACSFHSIERIHWQPTPFAPSWGFFKHENMDNSEVCWWLGRFPSGRNKGLQLTQRIIFFCMRFSNRNHQLRRWKWPTKYKAGVTNFWLSLWRQMFKALDGIVP